MSHKSMEEIHDLIIKSNCKVHEGTYVWWCLKSKMKYRFIALRNWEKVWEQLFKINKN